jgi:molybdopterin-guanine dinucleotide biosynthesis protein A
VNRKIIFGALLAGGAGARIGGDKAMTPLAGVALIAHVARVLTPSVSALAVVGDPPAAKSLHATDLSDAGAAGRGPLYGVSAALAWARAGGARWLVLAPCDTPFLPDDFVARLHAAAEAEAAPIAYAQTESGMHPLASLWRVDSQTGLDAMLAQRHPPVHTAIAALGGVGVAFWEAELANVNTREDLAAAEARLR